MKNNERIDLSILPDSHIKTLAARCARGDQQSENLIKELPKFRITEEVALMGWDDLADYLRAHGHPTIGPVEQIPETTLPYAVVDHVALATLLGSGEPGAKTIDSLDSATQEKIYHACMAGGHVTAWDSATLTYMLEGAPVEKTPEPFMTVNKDATLEETSPEPAAGNILDKAASSHPDDVELSAEEAVWAQGQAPDGKELQELLANPPVPEQDQAVIDKLLGKNTFDDYPAEPEPTKDYTPPKTADGGDAPVVQTVAKVNKSYRAHHEPKSDKGPATLRAAAKAKGPLLEVLGLVKSAKPITSEQAGLARNRRAYDRNLQAESQGLNPDNTRNDSLKMKAQAWAKSETLILAGRLKQALKKVGLYS